jgi:NTP pyrophosphatase (non-canonical NTP hydrolase)
MNAEQTAVTLFMQAFDQVVRAKPCIPPDEEVNLRLNLIEEEFNELQEAFVNKSKVEVADALADLLYVIYGTACSCGMDIGRVFNEVHASNMSKLWKSHEVSTLLNRDAQEIYQYNSPLPIEGDEHTATRLSKAAWVVKNKEGKIIKSPSYTEANIVRALSLD